MTESRAENISGTSSKIKFRREMPKVNMVVVDCPENPVINGKNRWKFPTKKDCCVRLSMLVKVNGSIKVGYNPNRHFLDENRKINGKKYFLEVSCITRHPISNDSLVIEPLNMVCLQKPLNAFHKHSQSDFGYWFRFFGQPCRFHIKISLKTQRGKADKFAEVISSVELDIVNREIISHKNINKPIKKPSRDCSLYSENEYLVIMEELQSLQDKCLWKECIAAGDRLLLEMDETKSDYKVCILLEQSKVACQQGELKDAKAFVKTALEMMSTTSRNNALLTGRAYTCLSLSHQHDKAFGNAEECLRIAKTKLFDFVACEDTGDYYYQKCRILLDFVFRSLIAHHKLINAAKEMIEMAICHFQQSYNSQGTAVMNKICSAQMYSAMLLALANKGDNSITDQMMSSMAKICVSLNCQTKCKFNFAKALLLEQKNDITAALEYGKTALELASTSGLCLEKQWIKDLLRRLSEKENEGSLICFMHHCDTLSFASDSQSNYEADESSDVELK